MRRGLPGASALALALCAALPSVSAAAQEDAALRHARELLRDAPLVDGHNDLPWLIRENATAEGDVGPYDLRQRTPHETDLARLREGQLAGVFWSVWIPSVESGSARLQLEQIDVARRMIAAYPEALLLATRSADVLQAKREGKIASFLGMENGRALEDSLGALRAYYDLGVRYMTLTHGRNTDWADSATDTPRHGGLSRFGREVVREMNRLGMLVDISHVSPAVMNQVLDVSEAPVIFSHASARAVTEHPRNVPDDVLARMSRNGGVVMVTFVPSFVSQALAEWGRPIEGRMQGATTIEELRRIQLDHVAVAGPAPVATLADVADHVEHVARVAGVDHVGIGSDFAGDGGPEGLEDVSRFPYLIAELVRRGWNDEDLRKLAGGNLIRAFAEAERVAERLQRSRPASTATFEALDGEAAAPASEDASPTTAEVLAASQPSDWRPLDPENTLYLELGAGRVVMELAPRFAPEHVANVKALVREGYFDGLAIVRVQDDYVVQWGDPHAEDSVRRRPIRQAKATLPAEFSVAAPSDLPFTVLPDGDVYAPEVGFSDGFPAARNPATGRAWLTHCYAALGVGRADDPDSGGGAELYVVNGHAPRHLDRNTALLGRVVLGMELLSTLPRGTGPLGFYETPGERIPIVRMRVAADLPEAERTPLERLRTDTRTFEAFVESRRNRRESWFAEPTGHIELCNVPLPVREPPAR